MKKKGGWGGEGDLCYACSETRVHDDLFRVGGGDRLCCVSSLCLEAVFSERARTNFSSLCVFVRIFHLFCCHLLSFVSFNSFL